MVDRHHLAGFKNLGKGARHHQPVFQNVGNAAGRAAIVFQNQKLSGLRIPHQIDTGNVRIDIARDLHADHFALEMAAGKHQRARNLPVAQNPLRAVNILQKQVQRQNALGQPRFEPRPLRVRENARHEVEREQTLRAPAVAIHGESDALQEKREIGQLPPVFIIDWRQIANPLHYLLIVRTRNSRGLEHLVVISAEVVPLQQIFLT